MGQVVYQGPHTAVVVEGIHAPRGEAVDVSDELGAQLIERGDFTAAEPPPSKSRKSASADVEKE